MFFRTLTSCALATFATITTVSFADSPAVSPTSAASTFAVPKLTALPTVDGLDNEPQWQNAAQSAISQRLVTGPALQPTSIRMYFTDEGLCIFLSCSESNIDKLVAERTTPDSDVYQDDCVEIFIAPFSTRPTHVFQVLINSRAAVLDIDNNLRGEDMSWTSGTKAACVVGKDRWTVEMVLPWSSMASGPITSDTIRMNIGRENHTNGELTTWAPLKTCFYMMPEQFMRVTLAGLTTVPCLADATRKTLTEKRQPLLERIIRERQAISKASDDFLAAQRTALLKQLADCERTLTSNDLSAVDKPISTFDNTVGVALAELHLRSSIGDTPLGVVTLSSMTKVRPDRWPTRFSTEDITFHAARGEAENAQAMLIATPAINDVKVTLSPLTSDSGATIASRGYTVECVPIPEPSKVGFGIPGDTPDPLRPFGTTTTLAIGANAHRSVWVQVCVPTDAATGVYCGTLTLASASTNIHRTVPISLTVHRATLPKTSRLDTAIGIWGGCANPIEKGLEYRFTVGTTANVPLATQQPDSSWTIADWSTFDCEVQTLLDQGQTMVRVANLLPMGQPYVPDRNNTTIVETLKLLDKHLVEKNWQHRIFFYLFDEPPEAAFAAVKGQFEFFNDIAPHVQNLIVNVSPKYHQLAGLVRLWVPSMGQWDEAFYVERRRAGDKAWMYQCGMASSDAPSICVIDRPGTSPRAVGWWLWRYQADGFLYWNVTGWKGDPWKNPAPMPGLPGEGILFYPNPDKANDVVPSIRAEAMRDGFEDYDLLVMVRDRLAKVSSTGTTATTYANWRKRAEAVIHAESVIPDVNTYIDDPSIYESRHTELLTLIDQFDTISAGRQ